MLSIDKIYDTIFPLGGIDDNNRYINLKGSEIGSVQLVEPTLSVNEFKLDEAFVRRDSNNISYKYAYRIPLVAIEDYTINQTDITAFKLDYTEFLPTLSFEFVDTSNSILSTAIPKDGAIIKVYIGGNGDELYYKPIRQDFVLTSIRKIGGTDQNYGGYMKYRVYGKLNVPYGYRKEAWCAGKCNVMQALFNISVWIGLGFSTNFTNTNTLDKMKWTNVESGTYFDFIQDITAHACYSPNTFFTSFIDQYNVLNFVECHSLLSHGGDKTDIPAMIYRAMPPTEIPPFDPETQEKTTKNQIPLKDGDDPLNNPHQKLSYYYLSNNDSFMGWTNFIEEYHEINNSNSSLSDGFRTYVNYSDTNQGDWDSETCEFHIRPIDNLLRDTSTQKIKPISETPSKDSYIPLNLMQITKEEYLENQSSVDNMTKVESFNNFGNIDTTNMFKQYFFAEVQNRYQMKCLKKCGLKVKLENYNPAVTKFSRVWVDIYDKNMMSNTEITKAEIRSNDRGLANEYKTKKNNNILKFEDEGVLDFIDDDERKNKNWPRGEYNRALSGWYVVTEIEIEYDPNDNNLKMNLTLNRIEYKPIFKNEYTVAKKAIDKYREENVIEDIIKLD